MRRLWLILLTVLAGASLWGMSLWQEPVELERFDNVLLGAAYISPNGNSLLNWQQGLYEQTQNRMSCFSPDWQDQWQLSMDKGIRAISGNSDSYFYVCSDSLDMRICKISQNGSQYWGNSGISIFSPVEYSQINELILLPDSVGGVFIVWKSEQYPVDNCRIQYVSPSGVSTMTGEEITIAENEAIYLEDAVLLADGSVAVTTAVRGMVHLYKINNTGLREWHREIVTEPIRFPDAAVSTAGNGNIILGIAHGDSAGIIRYDYYGSALGAEQMLCYPGSDNARYIRLIPSEDDCLYVNVCDYSRSVNMLQKLSNTGEVLYPNFISLNDIGYDINFGIYPAENGECYAVFNNGVDVITAKRLSSSGATLWEKDLLNVTNMNTTNYRFIGRCIDDVLHVAWMDFRADASGIYAQTLSSQGDELFSTNGLPVQIGSRGFVQGSDIVTLDESCAVLWVTLINGSVLKVNLQIIGKDGEQVFNPEPLSLGNNIIGYSEQAARVFAAGGNALVLWREQTDVQQLKVQLITSDGVMLWGNDGIVIAVGQIGAFCASVVDGAIMIAYDNYDSGVYSIYLQKVISGTTQWQPGGICLLQSDGNTYGQLKDFTGQYLLWSKMTLQSNEFCVLRVDSDGNISPDFPDDGLLLQLGSADYLDSYLMTDKLLIMFYYYGMDCYQTMLQIIDAQGNVLADDGDLIYNGSIEPSVRGDYIYTAEATSELVVSKYNLQQELIWEYHFQYPGLDPTAYSWARVIPLSDDEYIVLFSGTQPGYLLYAYFDAGGNFFLPGESQIFGVPLQHSTRVSLAEEGLFVLAGFPYESKLWLQHIGHHTDPIPDSELIPGVDILLLTNKPNPFRESTSLRIYLQEEIPIEVQIFNIRGQLVTDLYSGLLQKGLSNVHWNGRNNNGDICASGVYFIRLTSRFGTQTSKVLKLK